MIHKPKLLTLAAALFALVLAGPAQATVYTLSTWNTNELQTSLDTVTVIAGGGTSGAFSCQSNQICLHWNDGAGTATPTVKAIITFSYDDGSGASVAPATTAETGGSTAWNFNGAGNADGFGSFEKNNDKGTGNENTAGTTNWLVFTLDSAPTNVSNWDFAAHVQYNNGCSGWVSDRVHPGPTTSTECGSSRVPEPSTMILLGTGLIGLAVWGKRQRLSA